MGENGLGNTFLPLNSSLYLSAIWFLDLRQCSMPIFEFIAKSGLNRLFSLQSISIFVLAIHFWRVKSVYKSAQNSLYYSEIKERLTAEKKINPEVQEENICTKSNAFTILYLIFWYLRQFEQIISFPMTHLLLLLILLQKYNTFLWQFRSLPSKWT